MPKRKFSWLTTKRDMLELVRYNLAKEGYRVSCVTSGEQA
jgi:DNA-binding response OmpR family regulator